MTRLLALALVLSVLLVGSTSTNAQSGKKGAASKKPEATASPEFRPEGLAKLAVIVSRGDKENDYRTGHSDQARLVEDMFLECLLAKGHTVTARSDVANVLQEKSFQASGATDDVAKSVGKVLNVPAVLLVRITELEAEKHKADSGAAGRAGISARLINVETGSILWTGTHTGKATLSSTSATAQMLMNTASALAEAFPGKGPPPASEISPAALPKLAVITVSGTTGGRTRFGSRVRTEAAQTDRQTDVEDAFVQVLIQKGYGLATRSDIQAVAKEQKFQQSGLTEDNAVEAGKLLNVPAVLLVSITDFGTDQTGGGNAPQGKAAHAAVGARLVDVGTGKVIWSHADHRLKPVTRDGEANDLLKKVARDVAHYVPPYPAAPKELLERAERLEALGQPSAALVLYRLLAYQHEDKPEGRTAATRVKKLGEK